MCAASSQDSPEERRWWLPGSTDFLCAAWRLLALPPSRPIIAPYSLCPQAAPPAHHTPRSSFSLGSMHRTLPHTAAHWVPSPFCTHSSSIVVCPDTTSHPSRSPSLQCLVHPEESHSVTSQCCHPSQFHLSSPAALASSRRCQTFIMTMSPLILLLAYGWNCPVVPVL